MSQPANTRGQRRDRKLAELDKLGWCDFFEKQRSASDAAVAIPARVTEEHRGMYRVESTLGLLWAEVSGKFLHEAKMRADMPVVGDWLLVHPDLASKKSVIHRIFERRTKLSRKSARSEHQEQLVAANVDTAFVVFSLKEKMNLNRLERYVALMQERHIEPVILLTKTDLCTPDEIQKEIDAVAALAGDTGIHAISAKGRDGLNFILDRLSNHKTGVLLGASGAGKSTLLNTLIGEELQRVGAVRESDQMGRHTTTARRLVCLATGGMIIDTPGVRDLQIWENAQTEE